MVETSKERRMPVAVGDVVNDRYLVETLIGEGGVSLVFRARGVVTNQAFALKCLTLEAVSSARVVERFAREARAALAIKSAHVVEVHDVGTLPSGAPFLVMERLEGRDLAAWRAARGPLSVRQAAEFALHICEALAAAHGRGVVHRDIQPKNLFVSERGGASEIKLLDIGISQAALTGSAFATGNLPLVKTLQLTGRPLYLAPEQLRSAAEVDGRSDIWAIGMVLYEALAGKNAFAATTITASCAAILQGQPTPIGEVRRDVPVGFATIIERCLRKDPAQRFQNVGELAAALTRYAPTRARGSAERAADVLKSAGAIEESAMALATVFSSNPPPVASLPTEPPEPPHVTAPNAIVTTPFGPLLSQLAVQPPEAGEMRAAAMTAPAVVAPARLRARKVVIILGALAVISALAVVAMAVRSRAANEAAPTSEATPSKASASAPSLPRAVDPPARRPPEPRAPAFAAVAREPEPEPERAPRMPAAVNPGRPHAPLAPSSPAPVACAAAAAANPLATPAPPRARPSTSDPPASTGRTFRREM